LSTYALLSNFFITVKVFKESPFFGNGLGSHQISHSKYIDKLSGVEDFYNSYYERFIDLNAADANSLFLRIISEVGILGLVLVIYFLVKFYCNASNNYIISRSILIYILYKLFREGHYFSPEMYFFICIYYFNSISTKLYSHQGQ
jgi:O-antigen ligase